MNEYLLIIRYEDGSKLTPPDQPEMFKTATQDWLVGIMQEKKFVAGVGLPFEEAWVVWPESMVTVGAFGDRKHTIGGLITIKAASYQEALDLAKACPVLAGEGNSVEVRKVLPATTP